MRSLRLEPMRPEHLPLWLAWRQEPAAMRVMARASETLESLQVRLSRAKTDASDPDATELRWLVALEGDPIGTVVAREVDRRVGVAEIGYMLTSRVHRQGLGTRAVGLLVDRLFEEAGLERLWAKTTAINTPSRRLLARLGFTHEGTLRGHCLVAGARTDQVLYGLLRAEWAGRRDATR